MRLRTVLTVFFAVYIVALSFIPLVHDTLLAQGRWIGYGTGAYQFQNQNYFVLYNDPYDGSSKPHVHVNPSFAPATRISLMEFSDWTSYVNDHNLFNEFNTTMRSDANNAETLDVTYSGPDIVLYKYVKVSPDTVTVTFRCQKEFRAHLEMWRWVMASVNGISIKDAPKPMVITPTTLIEFTFEDKPLQSVGHGSITLSAVPVQIEIWPHEDGFNKITIDFVNSEMSFKVSGSMEAVGTPAPTWSYALLPYALPVVAISVVALYLLVDKYGRTLKNRVTRHSS